MNSSRSESQLSAVGDKLNRLLRRVGMTVEAPLALNAKVKRTYPKNA